jgi:hypothetical protein
MKAIYAVFMDGCASVKAMCLDLYGMSMMCLNEPEKICTGIPMFEF